MRVCGCIDLGGIWNVISRGNLLKKSELQERRCGIHICIRQHLSRGSNHAGLSGLSVERHEKQRVWGGERIVRDLRGKERQSGGQFERRHQYLKISFTWERRV